ncbi:MAG TPA: hypothetical protein VL993_08480, partial [Stellaceae bacterium]|nr:hypothetical protein [Stellaceae bacterium]
MGGYRLYFRRLDAIIGRHDFVAEDDIFALAVAAQVWRACSDLADAFELWTGERRVDSPGLKLPMPATMAEVTQKCVRQAEEA